MNQPYGSRPAFPIALFLFAMAMPFAAESASGDGKSGDQNAGEKASGVKPNAATVVPASAVPASVPAAEAAAARLAIPPRALRLKNPPPAPLKHLTYSSREGFALRMVSNQEVTAEIRNGAGRTLAFTARNLEAGDWTFRPRNLAPGFYTVLLRTGPNLRALHLKIGDAERGQGVPEWVVEKASDSTHAPAPSTPG
ncbi:MAG: hypothetical protein JF616_22500 [Fibrobacteres bacterium]|jgi:hypothetical protein|nr:hypothetical protein [Fibrobacterota bacterium]